MDLQNSPAVVQEEMAKAVCLFLAEMLRTRRATLKRCAEIAASVVDKLDMIRTEVEFLSAVRQMESDFQELTHLESDLTFRYQVAERQKMEELVREFAIANLPGDPERAVVIMEESLKAGSTLEGLQKKFPDFNEFVAKKE
ncbi:MAG: hypothetical protein HY398_01145 [Candidatus Doudnabacteria bacterium]|nr:hypothetical protein [Candidatus Doudnabacteria bacterium]